jgi:hypothetical protein
MEEIDRTIGEALITILTFGFAVRWLPDLFPNSDGAVILGGAFVVAVVANRLYALIVDRLENLMKAHQPNTASVGGIDISRVSFDTTGFSEDTRDHNLITWTGPADRIMLQFNPVRPEFPYLNELDKLRAWFREVAALEGGGLISVETPEVAGVRCYEAICKFPQQPTGMQYSGMLIIPFRDFWFAVSIRSAEVGMTGVRDTILLAQNLQENKFDPANPLAGLYKDPYDPSIKTGVLMNKSEEEAYDARFPDHPLSRVRLFLRKQLIESIKIDAKVFECAPFRPE